LGQKRFLKTFQKLVKRRLYLNKIYLKKMTKEIFTVAGAMWALTLTGLSVGFGLLKIQGE
jgi:hypothetical protein